MSRLQMVFWVPGCREWQWVDRQRGSCHLLMERDTTTSWRAVSPHSIAIKSQVIHVHQHYLVWITELSMYLGGVFSRGSICLDLYWPIMSCHTTKCKFSIMHHNGGCDKCYPITDPSDPSVPAARFSLFSFLFSSFLFFSFLFYISIRASCCIITTANHLLNGEYQLLPSRRRFRVPILDTVDWSILLSFLLLNENH